MADTIFIRDLQLSVLIGERPEERTAKQGILLNLELDCDTRKAGKSDDLRDAVDYSQVEQKVIECAENSSFFLQEALAEALASVCLSFEGVSRVRVTIDKPAAAIRARSIALSIERFR